jgi:hypothetical protein
MRIVLRLSCVLPCMVSCLPTQAALYRCPSLQEPGRSIVTNLVGDAEARQRDCTPLATRSSALDAPVKPLQAAAAPRTQAVPADRRIPVALQRERDTDRRAIIDAELRTEQQLLARAREIVKAAPAGDAEAQTQARQAAARHADNVDALQRELSRLR